MQALEAWIWRSYAALTSRTWLILWAILLGALLPAAHVASPALRWLIMGMLGLTFLGLRIDAASFRRSHLKLLLVPPLLGLALGFALRPLGPEVALSLALVVLTPTATAAPVILGLLGRRADYGAISVVGSNLFAAIYLPAVLAVITPIGLGTAERTASPWPLVVGTMITIFSPLLVALLVRRVAPAAARWSGRNTFSFALWLGVLFLVSAQTSHFLRESMQPPWLRVFVIIGLALVLCLLQFRLGRRLGEPDADVEAGQCLGQKNTLLTLWIAMTWYSPLIALGPASYVLWHNLYNSWQLRRKPPGPG